MAFGKQEHSLAVAMQVIGKGVRGDSASQQNESAVYETKQKRMRDLISAQSTSKVFHPHRLLTVLSSISRPKQVDLLT